MISQPAEPIIPNRELRKKFIHPGTGQTRKNVGDDQSWNTMLQEFPKWLGSMGYNLLDILGL